MANILQFGIFLYMYVNILISFDVLLSPWWFELHVWLFHIPQTIWNFKITMSSFFLVLHWSYWPFTTISFCLSWVGFCLSFRISGEFYTCISLCLNHRIHQSMLRILSGEFLMWYWSYACCMVKLFRHKQILVYILWC